MGIKADRQKIIRDYQDKKKLTDPESFQIGADEQQSFWEQMMKIIGTNTSTARNVSMEQAALSSSSDASRAASLRGVDYRSGMALEKGGFDLMKWISEYNRQGTQQAFSNKMAWNQYQLQKDAMDTSFWQDLMGVLAPVAGGAGYAMGQSFFSSGTKQPQMIMGASRP